MNTVFIKLFFSFISFIIFEYIISFVAFEIKKNSNVMGAIFLLIFCIGGIVLGNFVFWCN